MTAELAHGSKGGDLLLVRVKAPSGARTGHYEGVLTVRRGQAVSQRPADVEVLPFELMRPSKQYAVSRVPVSVSNWRAPEAVGAAPLHELRALGIGALCLSAPPADRAAIESAMRAAGLHGPVLAPVGPSGAPSQDHPPASEAPFTASSPPPSPVPSIRWYALWTGGPPPAAAMAAFKSSGMLLASPREEGQTTGGVDLPLFDADGAAGKRLVHREGTVGDRAAGWWRWDAGAATALENRLRCGALLWKSGLSGALVEISAEEPVSPGWALQWEGIRQGVLDSRYLTTLFSLIRQVKDKDRSNPAPGKAEVAVAAALNGVVEHPSPEAADRFRSLVITWILRLGRMV
jgi:hypothetical protein